MNGIPGGIATLPPVGADSRPPIPPAGSAPVEAATSVTAGGPDTAHPPAPTLEQLEGAVAELQESLDRLPGGERDVRLLYEEQDHSFVIEIRDKETGKLIQKFPPENLLNPSRGPADLLGTMIDRLS
ncbi:MAG TPA: flagellar protein FlaG [Candidatus Krumholzibacteria bacterium]|nr:flagellar protein FlaG [Candidatus Krumholzibacteria bacterium]